MSRERDYPSLFSQFWPIYQARPLQDNSGGCELPQLFGLWCFLRETSPTHVVESGAWKGQTTWLIETALPGVELLSIDPVPENRLHTSPTAHYSTFDFGYQDLSGLPPETTLAFFDDHQNPLKRLHQVRSWGFRWMIAEDNYPADCGDPSLRQMLAGAGSGRAETSLRNTIKTVMRKRAARFDDLAERYEPAVAKAILAAVAAEYEEFPPLATVETTRWGTSWRTSFPEHEASLKDAALDEAQRAAVERTARDWTAIALVDFRTST